MTNTKCIRMGGKSCQMRNARQKERRQTKQFRVAGPPLGQIYPPKWGMGDVEQSLCYIPFLAQPLTSAVDLAFGVHEAVRFCRTCWR